MSIVECPVCGRIMEPNAARYVTHSSELLGPECPMSRKPLEANALEEGVLIARAQKVMHLASLLRDEDPQFVSRHLERTDPGEVRLLLMTALLALPVDLPLRQAFDWVNDIGLMAS